MVEHIYKEKKRKNIIIKKTLLLFYGPKIETNRKINTKSVAINGYI